MTVGGFGSLVVGVGILALGVLAALAIWLARRTHRYLNVPLTAATVLVASALSLAITHIAQERVRRCPRSPMATTAPP